jgi:acyl-coenzyme A synthetase/AMP-(fatty) acid ligase
VAVPELDELRDLVAAQVARWAAPRQLVVVDVLPRTSGGKVRRSELA